MNLKSQAQLGWNMEISRPASGLRQNSSLIEKRLYFCKSTKIQTSITFNSKEQSLKFRWEFSWFTKVFEDLSNSISEDCPSYQTFEEASEEVAKLKGIEVNAKQIERLWHHWETNEIIGATMDTIRGTANAQFKSML